MTAIALVAASGLAREAAEVIGRSTSSKLVAVLDDDATSWSAPLAGVPITGPIATASVPPDAFVVLCAGKGKAREKLAQRLRDGGLPRERFGSVVHPSFERPGSGSLGVGAVILAGVTATADVHLGDHVVVMPGVILTHDDVVADFATLCAGVVLAGGAEIGRGAYLGSGALVREGVRIGAGATIGMGAVVLSDVPDGETWVGNPARPLRKAT